MKFSSSNEVFSNKRGVSAIISWVLIVAFVISLGTIVSRFMIDFTKEQTKEAKKIVFDSDECRSIAISIDTACHDTSEEVINLTISNRNFVKVEKILYKVLTENNRPGVSGELEFPINPDRIRHFCTSLRELYTHVLHHLSPNEEIRKWSQDPSHYVNKKPTRKARLLYICRGINHDSFTDFVKSDIDSVLSFVNILQGGTHSIQSRLTDKQLDAMLIRMESTLTYLIKTGKCE